MMEREKMLNKDALDLFNKIRTLVPSRNDKVLVMKLLLFKHMSEVQEKLCEEEVSKKTGYIIKSEFLWKNLKPNLDYSNMSKFFVKGDLKVKEIFQDKLGDYRKVEKREIIEELLKIIDSVDLNHDDEYFGDFMEKFIRLCGMENPRHSGTFLTAESVNKLLSELIVNNIKTKEASIYDPTSGVGASLLSVGKKIKEKAPDTNVSYWGQELVAQIIQVEWINLIAHSISSKNINLFNEDTLDSKPITVDGKVKRFDVIVEDPPYSMHWDNNDSKLQDPRFKSYEKLPPKTKADFAFLLQGLYSLKDDGIMTIVLPQGVLFRGAKEGHIRKLLLENNLVDAIVGLPANVLDETSIPVAVIILKKNKQSDDVLFIDASREFGKNRNKKNILRNKDIAKIADTYNSRKIVEKYSHIASLDEIKKNDYNLNISRYVDTYEGKPRIDIDLAAKTVKELDSQLVEIRKREKQWIQVIDGLSE